MKQNEISAPTLNDPASQTTPQIHLIGAQSAVSQHITHPIAMHSCNIQLHGVSILNDVIEGVENADFPPLEVEVSKKLRPSADGEPATTTEKAVISILSNAVRIRCEKEGEAWKAYHLTVDFPRLLKGHNGWTIQDENTFFLALSHLLQTVDKIVPAHCKGRIIPGIVHDCASFWSRIEFPLQFDDPDLRMFNCLFNARHSEVRKPPLKVQGQTVTWKGSELTVRAYMTGRQLCEKYKHVIEPEDVNVLRIELELKKGKLRQYFDVPEGCRLTRFTFDSLYTAFSRGMGGLQGVFHKEGATIVKGTSSARYIAQLINEKRLADNVSAEDLIKDYVKVKGLKPRQVTQLKSDVYKLLAQSSERLFLDWFPKDKPLPARDISPMRKSKSGGLFPVEHPYSSDLVIDPRIRKAYSSVDFIVYADTLKPQIYSPSPIL